MVIQIGEKEKGTFPSQPVANPKDARSTSSSPAQINTIHILRFGKEIDNHVVMPDQTISFLPKAVISSSGSDKSKEKEAEQVTEPLYEPLTPFPNKLRQKKHSAQVKRL